MKLTFLTVSTLLVSLGLTPSVTGQRGPFTRGPAVTTAGDFAVLADLGAMSAFDAEAAGTTVSGLFGVRANVGTLRSRNGAHASSVVTPVPGGVLMVETGRVRNDDPTQGGTAGTSSDAPGTTSPAQGAHSVQVAFAGIAAGTNAIVTLSWIGRASAGASATADVDVDGDGTADFSGTADGNFANLTVQVVAGANGVVLDITTNANAVLSADGAESYHAMLIANVREGTLPTSCAFTNFGAACGADLNGSVGATLDLALDVTNASADSFGFLLLGNQAATPVPLPMGGCDLLVDSRRRLGMVFRTDMTGTAAISLRAPRRALTISFQALLLSFDTTTGTRSLATSNGTELVCQ